MRCSINLRSSCISFSFNFLPEIIFSDFMFPSSTPHISNACRREHVLLAWLLLFRNFHHPSTCVCVCAASSHSLKLPCQTCTAERSCCFCAARGMPVSPSLAGVCDVRALSFAFVKHNAPCPFHYFPSAQLAHTHTRVEQKHKFPLRYFPVHNLHKIHIRHHTAIIKHL